MVIVSESEIWLSHGSTNACPLRSQPVSSTSSILRAKQCNRSAEENGKGENVAEPLIEPTSRKSNT
jgi:hypothetical protein